MFQSLIKQYKHACCKVRLMGASKEFVWAIILSNVDIKQPHTLQRIRPCIIDNGLSDCFGYTTLSLRNAFTICVHRTILISRFRTCISEPRPSFQRIKTLITPLPFCHISVLALLPIKKRRYSISTHDTFLELPLVG